MCKLSKLTDKISLTLLCVLMADCCIFGAGRIITFGSISFRMILVAGVLFFSIPQMYMQISRLLHSTFLLGLLGFALMLIFATAYGFCGGNSNTAILTDLKGFSYFSVAVAAVCTLTNHERIHLLMKIMMYASCALSMCTLLNLVLFIFFKEAYLYSYLMGLAWKFSAFSQLSEFVPRLFFYSSPYLLCGCAFCAYFQLSDPGRKIRWRYILITTSCLTAILLTYTRSIYLATFVAIVVFGISMLLCRENIFGAKAIKHIGFSAVASILVLVCFNQIGNTDFFAYGVQRVSATFAVSEGISQNGENIAGIEDEILGLDGDEVGGGEENQSDSETTAMLEDTRRSDNVRAQTKQELLLKIRQSPLIGNGLGVTLECRDTEVNEYIYLDVLAKMGTVGLLLFFLPCIMIAICLFKKLPERKILVPWISILLGMMAFSYYNPYMNASLGILFYCCAIAVGQFVKESVQ